MKGRISMNPVKLGAALLTLLLSACAPSPDAGPTVSPTNTATATPPPTPGVLAPGEFTFTTEGGGIGTLRLPAPPLPEIEELRALAGGEPLTYISASVDNSKGSTMVDMYGVTIFTVEGEELSYRRASDYIDELRRKLPISTPPEAQKRFSDLSGKYRSQAPPQEVREFFLVGPPVPEQFARVHVYPSGAFNFVLATPRA